MNDASRIGRLASRIACIGAIAVALSACALPPLPARPGPATIEARNAQIATEVMQIEREINNTTDIRGDYQAALKYFPENYISIDPSGKVSDREASLSWVKEGRYKGESTTYDDVKIRVFGDGNTAIFTAISHFKGMWDGQPLDLRQRFTNVYVKQNGQWQMVSQHVSDLSGSH